MAIDKTLPLQPNINANNIKAGKKTIEETYQKKTQLEHILLRPDTYIGSVEKHPQTLWVYENETMVQKPISYVPGLYKIFDEILVNAADNKQRDPKMDSVKVVIDAEENVISVYNNGDGVPVEIHQEEGVYVPEMIFGMLLTSSNYDDSEMKTTGGRNGYGAKLTNIFSTEFVIETADGKRLKKYKQVFSNNMGKKSEPSITKCKEGENWTKVTFKPDLAKFKMDHLEDDVVALMKKRVIDIAGCLGKTVKVELNGKRVPVKSFSDYVDLYLDSANKDNEDKLPRVMEKVNDRWEICVSLSEGQFQQVSFVNSIATIKGGTHVDYVTNQIANHVMNSVNKNKNINVKAHTVKSHMWIFVNALIDNPAFDSQTKETLTIRQTSFGSKCDLSTKFLNKVATSGLEALVKDWADAKRAKDLKKTDGKRKGRITGLAKLDDANEAGGKNSEECTLILTEGDSAKSLALAGISVVGRNRYGVFPLRGKLLNVREASHKQIMENAEIQNIKQILGLQQGKIYDNVKSLRYGHLMIMTDQDHDGSHIKGLLINFIHSFWPSLLKIPSFLLEFITPIVKAAKTTNNKQEVKSFYSMPEYESWKESLGGSTRGWSVKYYKGLGTSTNVEGQEYFHDLDRHKKDFVWGDEEDGDAIEMAFSKKKIEARKNWLRQFEPGTYLDSKEKLIKYGDFVNKELILFSIADLQRSIPSMVDGLKPGQRKILFCSFKRNLVSSIKISQFSGYVSEHSAYHHGEQSLASTIIGLAQNFVGSNNINLFNPEGQFGSRIKGGKDAASARYIFTKLSGITRFLFHKDDDDLLEYLNEDGQPIEPVWYMPIIPLVLVNGSEGIGTGWSTYIPNYNPRDIVANIRRLLNGEAMEAMDPWYRGFMGTIEKTATKESGVTYTVSGIIEEVNSTTLRITELPIRRWTEDYKAFLESAMTGTDKIKEPFIMDYNVHQDRAVHFEIFMEENKLNMAKQEGLLKKFSLTTSFSTSNMHLFDPKGAIKKFVNPEQILEEFFPLRLEFYDKRKKFLLEKNELELLKLDNKVRFILAVVRGEIIVSNRKRKDLLLELQQKGFTPFPKKIKNVEAALAGAVGDAEENEDNSVIAGSTGGRDSDYDYLLSMSIGTLTLEKVQELIASKDRLVEDIEEYKKVTSKSLWLKDLDALEKELDKQDKADEEEAASSEKSIVENNKGGKKASKKPTQNPKKNNSKKVNTSVAEIGENPGSSTTETGNVVEAVKPKGKGGPRKAPAKKEKVVLVDNEDDENEMLGLNERLAAYHIDSSPEPSAAMEIEETISEETMVEKSDKDTEFVADPKGGKKKGGKKPAATANTVKPAAATRKRGPAAKKPLLSQKLITDVLKPAEVGSPDKKVRKLRPSPFNKKSSSVLGRIGDTEQSGSSSSASGSPVDANEVVAAKPRPQRANRKAAIVLSSSESDDSSDDSEFDA